MPVPQSRAQPGGAMRRIRPGDSAAGRSWLIMHVLSRAHPVGAAGPAVTASAVSVDAAPGVSHGCPGTGPVLGGQPARARTGQPTPTGPPLAQADHGLPQSLAQ